MNNDRQVKVRICNTHAEWLQDNYNSYKDGINDCINRCMNDTTNETKRILSGMRILANAVKELHAKYPDIDFSELQKGVDRICQTSSPSRD